MLYLIFGLICICLSPLLYLYIDIKNDSEKTEKKVEFVGDENVKRKYNVGERFDNDEFVKAGCPFCSCKEIIEGPHGGSSINFTCSHCGAKFNYMGPFGIEILSDPTKI
jgi:tRNA G26 N,N-dimethylase Trm1